MAISDAVGVLLDGYTPSILLATAAILLVCWQRLSVKLDPQEPPLLKPTIPYIGHIIGMFKHHSGYFDMLYAKSPMPIATLPMLNGKMYMITSPVLAQSAFRNKNLSFEPFVIEFAQRMLGVSDETMIPIRFEGDEKRLSFVGEFSKAIHAAMAGEYLHKMNADALNRVAVSLNEITDTFQTDSLYLWIRSTMTVATCNALLGSHNPMIEDPSLINALWDFEAGILGLLLGIFPSFFVPKAYKGRKALQNALVKYYSAKHDLEPDVARMTSARSETFRKHGISDADIGRFELALLHVSTANAIPTLFWQICFLASSPATTSLIRDELMSMVVLKTVNGKRVGEIDITKFDSNCPILVSSYRETIRLANSQMGTRRVMTDTVLSDGKNGYLLRKGCDIQLPAGIPHSSTKFWGPDAASFDAKRFLTPEDRGDMSQKSKIEDREQKKAYFPFGGGKHLCPGRNFAFAEILGTVAVLVLGFDVKGTDGGLIQVPALRRAMLGEGVVKPNKEGIAMGAKIERRKGWEDVEWKYTC